MTPTASSFVDLLDRAVREPGIISNAYRAFHGYSIGNRLLALTQCEQRGITPGPIATFPKWKALGRFVRKGERAIVLCQPVTCKRRAGESDTTDDDRTEQSEQSEQNGTFTRFVHRPHWFVLAQTDGNAIEPEAIPTWDSSRALQVLGITEEPFSMLDGNCQGYARERSIAVSPVAAHPHKTRFHELAHVLLGHTAEGTLNDDERTQRNLREVEAEAVALLCLEALDLPGSEYARGYIQSWNASRNSEPIPERSAQRILKAADQILRAGRAVETPESAL